MSYSYMALYTGDYLRDTRHLTPQKHGIYILLLMYCWDNRCPAPLDEQECAGIANCRSADEIDSMRYILGRYFVRMDDGWYNPRMVKLIEQAEALSTTWSEAGKRGAQARIKLDRTKAKPRLRVGQASATTQTQTQIQTTDTDANPTHKEPSQLLPSWLPISPWEEYQQHRKALRAPLTGPGVGATLKKLEKLRQDGHDPKAVLEQSIANGWRGIFPLGKTARSTNGAQEWLDSQQPTEKDITDERF